MENIFYDFLDVPEPPDNVTIINIQSRSIDLVWMEPHDNNAPIQGYIVRFNYKEPRFGEKDLEVSLFSFTSDTRLLVSPLLPGLSYRITVIADNAIGLSAESDVLNVETLEEGTSVFIVL